MATYTTNLSLRKPGNNDPISVENDWNDNLDKIDNAYQTARDNVDVITAQLDNKNTIKADNASLSLPHLAHVQIFQSAPLPAAITLLDVSFRAFNVVATPDAFFLWVRSSVTRPCLIQGGPISGHNQYNYNEGNAGNSEISYLPLGLHVPDAAGDTDELYTLRVGFPTAVASTITLYLRAHDVGLPPPDFTMNVDCISVLQTAMVEV